MNKSLVPHVAAYLAITASHAAERQVLKPPNPFAAAHAQMARSTASLRLLSRDNRARRVMVLS